MFAQVLVPLDGTDEAAAALPWAANLVQATNGLLTLVRVVSAWQAGEAERLTAIGADQARVADELAQCGLRVNTTLRRVTHADEIPTALVDAARDQGADLIVMATHARSGLARVTYGSVAEQVLVHSPVPVLLLTPEEVWTTRPSAILAPVDGTAAGSQALDVAADLAAAFGAEVLLLRVVVPMVAREGVTDPDQGESEALVYDQLAIADAQRQVEMLADQLRARGIAAQGRALFGGLPETILEVAERMNAGVIVMSTHARSGMVRVVLGSVADAVVRQAGCPTLLVRRDGGTGGEGGL